MCYLGRQSLLNCAMLRKISPIALFFIALQAFIGCVNDAVPPATELKLGDSTFFGSITVYLGGGTFHAGLSMITFPANSYTSTKVVNISTNDITGSTFGNNITAVTPLYTVDAGGDYANQDIIFKIPVTLDTNNFSMAFFYD